MTQIQYGWIDAEMQQRQILAVQGASGKPGGGASALAMPPPASGFPAEVMLAALDYAKTSGLPLGEVIAMLRGA